MSCSLLAVSFACADDGATEAEAAGDGDGDTGEGDTGEGDGDGDGDGDPFECVEGMPPNPPLDRADAGIVFADEFEPFYECYDLGTLPNVPINWGGLTVKIDDPYKLLIGGSANTLAGKLYAVDITRDVDCHVTGWAGDPIVDHRPRGLQHRVLTGWPQLRATRVRG